MSDSDTPHKMFEYNTSPTQSHDWNSNHPARPTSGYDQTFPPFSSFPPSPISPFNGYTPYDPSYTAAHSHETHYASSSMSMNPGLVRWPSTGSTLTAPNIPHPPIPQNGPGPTASNHFALPSFTSYPDLPSTFLPYQDASYQPWEFNFGSDTDSDCDREKEIEPIPVSSAQPDLPIIASASTSTLGLLPSAIIVDTTPAVSLSQFFSPNSPSPMVLPAPTLPPQKLDVPTSVFFRPRAAVEQPLPMVPHITHPPPHTPRLPSVPLIARPATKGSDLVRSTSTSTKTAPKTKAVKARNTSRPPSPAPIARSTLLNKVKRTITPAALATSKAKSAAPSTQPKPKPKSHKRKPHPIPPPIAAAPVSTIPTPPLKVDKKRKYTATSPSGLTVESALDLAPSTPSKGKKQKLSPPVPSTPKAAPHTPTTPIGTPTGLKRKIVLTASSTPKATSAPLTVPSTPPIAKKRKMTPSAPSTSKSSSTPKAPKLPKTKSATMSKSEPGTPLQLIIPLPIEEPIPVYAESIAEARPRRQFATSARYTLPTPSPTPAPTPSRKTGTVRPLRQYPTYTTSPEPEDEGPVAMSVVPSDSELSEYDGGGEELDDDDEDEDDFAMSVVSFTSKLGVKRQTKKAGEGRKSRDPTSRKSQNQSSQQKYRTKMGAIHEILLKALVESIVLGEQMAPTGGREKLRGFLGKAVEGIKEADSEQGSKFEELMGMLAEERRKVKKATS